MIAPGGVVVVDASTVFDLSHGCGFTAVVVGYEAARDATWAHDLECMGGQR